MPTGINSPWHGQLYTRQLEVRLWPGRKITSAVTDADNRGHLEDANKDDISADADANADCHLGGRENWSGLMQPPLIGKGCSIPGTRPENDQIMRCHRDDNNSDQDGKDLGEVQGSPLLPEERSLQGDEGTRGLLRNQNLQKDLQVHAWFWFCMSWMEGHNLKSYLASKESHSHPVGQLLHSPLLGSLVLEPDLNRHMVLIGPVHSHCSF